MVVIHIGPPKTATTYIQKNLSSNTKALSDAGWNYPTLGRGIKDTKVKKSPGRILADLILPNSTFENRQLGHHDIAREKENYIKDDGEFYADLKKIGSKSKNKKIIFSAEGFSSWSPKEFKDLADILGVDEQDVRIVYTLRNPIELLHSHWTEEIKQGCTWTLPARLSMQVGNEQASRILNPLATLNPMRNETKMDLKLISYDYVSENNLDMFEVFCASVGGAEHLKPVVTRHINTKYPLELTEFLRMLTTIYADGKWRVNSKFRLKFTEILTEEEQDKIVGALKSHSKKARRVLKYDRPNPLYNRLEAEIKKHYSDKFLHPVPEKCFGQSGQYKMHYYDDVLLMRDAKVRELVEFHYERTTRALGE